VTAFQNVRLLKWCAEYGLRVFWNVIYGFPGEPPEEYARMAAIVPALEHLSPPTLGPLVLDRFSPYHERPGDFGLEIAGPLPYYGMIYPVDEATLNDLAYSFQYAHADDRDPDAYVAPLRRAIDEWRAAHQTSYRALRYRRGPGFLVVRDGRAHSEQANYTFGEREAALYLACEDGATAAEAHAAVHAAGAPEISSALASPLIHSVLASRLRRSARTATPATQRFGSKISSALASPLSSPAAPRQRFGSKISSALASPLSSPAAPRQRFGSKISVDEVREFLDELARSRLVYAEGGRYLALALPWRLPEAV
jgi:hypothetical protein